MVQNNVTKLLFSQLFMIAGLVMASVGLVGALVADIAWLYGCPIGIMLAVLGSLLLRNEIRSSRRKVSTDKSSSENEVINLVLQNNIAKLVTGLTLTISGMLMIGAGLIVGLTIDSNWFPLCIIGLLSIVPGIWLMQSEVRHIISALREAAPSPKN